MSEGRVDFVIAVPRARSEDKNRRRGTGRRLKDYDAFVPCVQVVGSGGKGREGRLHMKQADFLNGIFDPVDGLNSSGRN